MYKDGPIDDVVIRKLARYNDHRGWLTEIYRNDEVDPQYRPVMMYISETNPGVARGPHEHVDQADMFGFIGPSDFKLYLWDNRPSAKTHLNKMSLIVGVSNPITVIIPPGVVHAYKNVGSGHGWVMNLPNQLYKGEGKKQPVDEIRHEDIENSPFVLD
jgi:dTDP-4-dehydrorhamnose 3,5-epimerase